MCAIAAFLIIILWTGLIMWVSLLQKQYASKLPKWVEGLMYVERRWRYYYIKSFKLLFISAYMSVCLINLL